MIAFQILIKYRLHFLLFWALISIYIIKNGQPCPLEIQFIYWFVLPIMFLQEKYKMKDFDIGEWGCILGAICLDLEVEEVS